MSEEELLEWLGDFKKEYFKRYNITAFIPDLLAEQAYQQIRKLIEGKPKVTREFVDEWLEENWDENWCWHTHYKEILGWLIKLLTEAGVEVEK